MYSGIYNVLRNIFGMCMNVLGQGSGLMVRSRNPGNSYSLLTSRFFYVDTTNEITYLHLTYSEH